MFVLIKRLSLFSLCLATLASQGHAAELKNSKDLFQRLLKVTGLPADGKPPVTISMSDFQCDKGGMPAKMKCRAVYGEPGKEISFAEEDGEDIYHFLKKKNAPFATVPAVGAVTYKLNQLDCAYSLKSFPYYSCGAQGRIELQ